MNKKSICRSASFDAPNSIPASEDFFWVPVASDRKNMQILETGAGPEAGKKSRN